MHAMWGIVMALAPARGGGGGGGRIRRGLTLIFLAQGIYAGIGRGASELIISDPLGLHLAVLIPEAASHAQIQRPQGACPECQQV